LKLKSFFTVAFLLAVSASLFAFQPLFDTWLSYEVDTNPYSLCSADLDGDGDDDLAVVHYNSYANTVVILKNNGQGYFTEKGIYGTAGVRPRSVCAADVDKDGDLDLIIANYTSNNAAVLKNNGNAEFSYSASYATGSGPTYVSASDLDGDNDQDFVVSNGGSSYGGGNTASIFKNNGNGTFAPKVDYSTGFNPNSMYIADFDMDGDQDIATANAGQIYSPDTSSVSILKNNGDGTFAPKVDYLVGPRQYLFSIASSDFDGDGDLDLAVQDHGNFYTSGIWLLKNNGSGIFDIKIFVDVGGTIHSFFSGDFDKDGDQDIALTNTFNAGILSVLLLTNNGNMTFSKKAVYPMGFYNGQMTGSDFDNDGDLDLAVTAEQNWMVGVLKNKGDGTFVSPSTYNLGYSPVIAIASDLDNDGAPDLVSASSRWGLPYIPIYLSVLKNNGDGSFATKVDYDQVGTFVVAADFNGDGYNDLAAQNLTGISILRNKGDGTFPTKVDYNIGSCAAIATADFDNDDDKDLAIAKDSTILILKNDGIGNFSIKHSYITDHSPLIFITSSDLDGDEDYDLIAVKEGGSGKIVTLKNYGDASFSNATYYYAELGSNSVAVADFDKDGDNDLAVAKGEIRGIDIFTNSGNGTFPSKTNYLVGQNPRSVAATDIEGDGDIDLVFTNPFHGTVSILKNNGTGIFGDVVEYGSGYWPYSLFPSDLDNDGDQDLIIANEYDNTLSVLKNLSNTGCANKLGDLDHNCLLTLDDIVLELNCAFLGYGNCALNLTDVNCDGYVSAADVVILLNSVFLNTPFPCP